MLNLIKDMYDKAKCRVKWNNRIGTEIDSQFGVLQGGMLSPKLFTEFLSDLKDFLNKLKGVTLKDNVLTHILYADDMVLCSDTEEGLQEMIDGLYKFCSKWHLIVSLAKTNVMVFNKKAGNKTFKFGESEIKYTSEYKYLGTVIADKCQIFKNNTTNLANKSKKAAFALNSYIKSSVGYLQPNLAIKLFDAQISPILEYASEIWYNRKYLDELEKIHLAFLKNTLRVKPSSSTLAIYAELGRFPLALKVNTRLIKYWQKICKLDNSHLVKQAYLSMYELHTLGQDNWCNKVRSILEECNMGHLWDNQTLCNKDLSKIKENMHRNFMGTCMANIQDENICPKLRTYALFKNEFKSEPYVINTLNIHHTLALIRFRISSHNLAIETGRYSQPKTPVNNRKCLYCQNDNIESEQHFLLKCSLYTNERIELITKIKTLIPDIDNLEERDKFISIMSNRHKTITDAVGKYVFNSFKIRNSQNQ